jgi:outer membrane translocation and assembly module TamA
MAKKGKFWRQFSKKQMQLNHKKAEVHWELRFNNVYKLTSHANKFNTQDSM